MHKTKSGFTIVELLIVIVVIGILAVISVVAYNGIQNRANDAALQTDIHNLAQQIVLYNADSGVFPSVGQLSGLDIKVNKSAYFTSNNAMLYCAPTDGATFAIIGRSKSGTTYYSSSSTGSVKVASFSFPTGSATDCPNAGSSNSASGWLHSYPSGWLNWVKG